VNQEAQGQLDAQERAGSCLGLDVGAGAGYTQNVDFNLGEPDAMSPILSDFLAFLSGLAKLQPAQLSIARFLLDRGQVWPAQALPKGYGRGKPKLCYANAALLVASDLSLRYAEGYVLSPRTGHFPIEHAWALTEGGAVLDNTLPHPEANLYFGVAFAAHDLLVWLSVAEVYGIFGDQSKRVWVERVLTGMSLESACQDAGLPSLPEM
jgi:hypothetical protein